MDIKRRRGEYNTPIIWVNEAHKMISESFGEDWKEKYIVWDPAAGTLNLTRDYNFKELYCSTINQTDLDIANQNGYNMNAVKFQYDFLNDGIKDGEIDVENDDKLPDGLKRAILNNKPIIVFMNPPYGRANSNDKSDARISTLESKATKTETSKMMLNDGKYGASSAQLYTQFLYKLIKLSDVNNNINIAVYAKSLYLTGSSFQKFRTKFLEKFRYDKGMLFNSSHFSDTSDCWAIDFSLWKNGNELFELSVNMNKEIDNIILSDRIEIPDINRTNNIYIAEN